MSESDVSPRGPSPLVAMFDAVMNGMPVQEAVDKFMAEMKEKPDDIELF